MKYATNEHLEILQALDNHVKWLKEAYDDKGEFFFHIKKLEGLIGDLADYFGAHKRYIQRPPDVAISPNKFGRQPGIPYDMRSYTESEIKEKSRLYGKYGDVFNQDTIGDVDE